MPELTLPPEGLLCVNGGTDILILWWDLVEGAKLYSLGVELFIHYMCFSINGFWLCLRFTLYGIFGLSNCALKVFGKMPVRKGQSIVLLTEWEYQNVIRALERRHACAAEISTSEIRLFFVTSPLNVHLMQWVDVNEWTETIELSYNYVRRACGDKLEMAPPPFNAHMSKAHIQKFADIVASIFVHVVVCMSFLTFFAWYIFGMLGGYPEDWLLEDADFLLFSLMFGISVVVIACPCAFGLTTPTAVLVAIDVEAFTTLITKGGDALERGQKVRYVLSGKKETLPQGKSTVTTAAFFTKLDRGDFLTLVASTEASSIHPFSNVIVEYALKTSGLQEPDQQILLWRSRGVISDIVFQHGEDNCGMGLLSNLPNVERGLTFAAIIHCEFSSKSKSAVAFTFVCSVCALMVLGDSSIAKRDIIFSWIQHMFNGFFGDFELPRMLILVWKGHHLLQLILSLLPGTEKGFKYPHFKKKDMERLVIGMTLLSITYHKVPPSQTHPCDKLCLPQFQHCATPFYNCLRTVNCSQLKISEICAPPEPLMMETVNHSNLTIELNIEIWALALTANVDLSIQHFASSVRNLVPQVPTKVTFIFGQHVFERLKSSRQGGSDSEQRPQGSRMCNEATIHLVTKPNTRHTIGKDIKSLLRIHVLLWMHGFNNSLLYESLWCLDNVTAQETLLSFKQNLEDKVLLERMPKDVEPDDSESSNCSDESQSAPRSSGKKSRETSPTSVNAINKNSLQIKKPLRRKGSPLGWFPRGKVEPYLKRKIKLLQEIAGMNSTLDQTLGDSNPHYTRVKREQMAAREAALKAMEARKAALVEASWCRILRAARIQCKEAEETRLKAEDSATKALEEATELGVIMYDMPGCPRKSCEIKLSSTNGGGSTTHAVAASFETAFEVDKEVAAAVKTAFTRLASCASLTENELKDILRKISENPDSCEISKDACPDIEPDGTTELDSDCQKDQDSHQSVNDQLSVKEVAEQKNNRKKQDLKDLSMEKLVNMMLERLKCLQEDELASLATIVATCGLSAALAKEENSKQHEALNFARRMSSFGVDMTNSLSKKKPADPELPSLDKYLVKHMSKLEKEVSEAKIKKKEKDMRMERIDEQEPSLINRSAACSDTVPDLGSILIKHSSKLEKETEAAKRNGCNQYESIRSKSGGAYSRVGHHRERDATEIPSLDKCLVKHMSKLEREVHEARFNRANEARVKTSEKENMDSNKHGRIETEDSLEKILIKPVHRLEKEKMQVAASGNYRVSHQKQQAPDHAADCESLDKVLVKHVSRLEKEKLNSCCESKDKVNVTGTENGKQAEATNDGGLGEILVKHKSKLEQEKLSSAQQQSIEEPSKHSAVSRREARERELQAAWGGLSLGNSVKPHISRLERDKAAWIKAEKEEKMQATAH